MAGCLIVYDSLEDIAYITWFRATLLKSLTWGLHQEATLLEADHSMGALLSFSFFLFF